LSKLRGNLETLVENLPRKLQDIEVRLQLYASERRIHDAIEKLYLAILIALEEVVRYYTEKAGKVLPKSMSLIGGLTVY
jgi:hypothetical protein